MRKKNIIEKFKLSWFVLFSIPFLMPFLLLFVIFRYFLIFFSFFRRTFIIGHGDLKVLFCFTPKYIHILSWLKSYLFTFTHTYDFHFSSTKQNILDQWTVFDDFFRIMSIFSSIIDFFRIKISSIENTFISK